ncbi:unnamed protein product [Oikopleura dioica]|uniref:Uncharacterized protein n=1 Tax=Oikopleura dioica TaxID=34765 RepID=E4X1L2_OIKDI|nr:unnamed protein product [Oikopleura dioica]CBY36486.1 unnamed protein product [Oikopleura dioica]
MRELKLQYGMYKNGEMISIGDISDFPKSNSGKIKIPDLQKNENYWVVLAAKNEKFPSKTVSCDVTAKDSSQNRVLFLAIGSFVFLLIVGLAIDVTCYFTKQQGLLNRIVARKIPAGAKPIGANSSEEASSTDESEEKCLKSKLDEDSEDQGMGSLTESATRLETVKEVGEN